MNWSSALLSGQPTMIAAVKSDSIIWKTCARLDCLLWQCPAAKGGGITLRQIAHIVARVAEGDPSTALILAMQYLQTLGIAASSTWPEDVREDVFESIVQSGALLNALRVEPELGTPTRGGIPATRVRRDGDRWLLSGRKIFSTGEVVPSARTVLWA